MYQFTKKEFNQFKKDVLTNVSDKIIKYVVLLHNAENTLLILDNLDDAFLESTPIKKADKNKKNHATINKLYAANILLQEIERIKLGWIADENLPKNEYDHWTESLVDYYPVPIKCMPITLQPYYVIVEKLKNTLPEEINYLKDKIFTLEEYIKEVETINISTIDIINNSPSLSMLQTFYPNIFDVAIELIKEGKTYIELA